MPLPFYYLVNHTRKEFCFFDNNKSIFLVLETMLNQNNHWNRNDDDIRIGSEGSCSTSLLGFLVNSMGYNEIYNE